MGRSVRIGLLALVVAGSLMALAPSVALANHNACVPHATGDDIASWPILPGDAFCRDFIVDSGHGTLMTRQGLLDRAGIYTSSVGRFSMNFLWYSNETSVTVSDRNMKWTACTYEPGYHQACDPGQIRSDYSGKPGSGPVLRAYNYPSSVTLSAFEYGGAWIAKACGNWKDVAERPDPVPFIDGIKFRDDNRNGVRDGEEPTLAGWDIRVTRVRSDARQTTGVVGTVQTGPDGAYRFDLKDHGPGRYRVEEVLQPGWMNYTPAGFDVEVEYGGGARRYTRDFGNAQTRADVAKVSTQVVSPPSKLDVNVPTDVTVRVTIENLGPAAQVPVEDTLTAVLPLDCSTPEPALSFRTLLVFGTPVTRTFTFPITCRQPSLHAFRFDDRLSITGPDITETTPSNNFGSASFVAPVHAYTDISTSAALSCAPSTSVGVAATCVVAVAVANRGFGPVDATAVVRLALPSDCVAVPGPAVLTYPALADGGSRTQQQSFAVTCSHRSFHDIRVSTAVTADDPHVFDTDPANNAGGDGPSIMEVFHDATMAVTDVHLVCNEVLGQPSFTCTARVDYVKTGPAPLVEVVLKADLTIVDACTAAPDRHLEQLFVLDGGAVQTRTFSWSMTCPSSNVLHPFAVTVDISPSVNEPHAVDAPGARRDQWVVPYCLPTVNPHGQKQPQAPGSGMNEDGFYVFGTLAVDGTTNVSIRDTGSDVVFGPFPSGTRIKWVEANGATPKLSPMAGNNGTSGGQATAVDYQVLARGDAQAFFVDEKGVAVTVTCLVPPFPK